MLVLLTAATLSGCSASSERIEVILPPAPDYAAPVNVRDPRKGETLVGIAARERAGRIAANARLVAFREWYESLQRGYAGTQQDGFATGNGNGDQI